MDITLVLTNADWAAAFWQAAGAIGTVLTFALLIWQEIRTEKLAREANIRSTWALLHAERQRLESDVSAIDAKGVRDETSRRRREVLAKRIEAVSKQMADIQEKYPKIFRF